MTNPEMIVPQSESSGFFICCFLESYLLENARVSHSREFPTNQVGPKSRAESFQFQGAYAPLRGSKSYSSDVMMRS